MYNLYIDRPETFEAKIVIEGASQDDANCRLVVETNNGQFLFPGTYSNNKANIQIKNLKRFLSEGSTGKLKLEVITDGMYFTPWESQFSAKLSKKVTAEVVNKKNETMITEVKVTKTGEQAYISEQQFVNILQSKFKERGINIYNIAAKRNEVKKIVESIFKSDKILVDTSIVKNVVAHTTKALLNNEK